MTSEPTIGLVEKLLSSLDLPTHHEIERSWVEEAERRVAETDRGAVELIPGERVFEKMRQEYDRGQS